MTKRFSTLQKKVQELQSQILQLSVLSAAGDPIPESLSQDIEQRCVFLNNLLSAEIASSPSKPTTHLHHIAHRLSDLESAFRDFRAPAAGELETEWNCSCTGSCLNDEEEEGGSDAPEEDFYVAVEEQAHKNPPPPVPPAAPAKGSFWGRRDWVVMGSGVIIGGVVMGLVMIKFCGCFHLFIGHEGFVVPT